MLLQVANSCNGESLLSLKQHSTNHGGVATDNIEKQANVRHLSRAIQDLQGHLISLLDMCHTHPHARLPILLALTFLARVCGSYEEWGTRFELIDKLVKKVATVGGGEERAYEVGWGRRGGASMCNTSGSSVNVDTHQNNSTTPGNHPQT